MGSVHEDDVWAFFQDFKVESVFRDHDSWYVTFRTADSARRATMVLNSGARTLAHHSVSIMTCPPPPQPTSQSTKALTEEEVIQHAEQMIVRELKALWEKDIAERVVAAGLRRLVAEEKAKAADAKLTEDVDLQVKPIERRGLKGLSFRKPGKRAREDEDPKGTVLEAQDALEAPSVHAEEVNQSAPAMPLKKRRKEELDAPRKEILTVPVESEDEESISTEARKRHLSEAEEDEEPTRKRVKKDAVLEDDASLKKTKTLSKKKPLRKKGLVKEVIEDLLLSETFEYAPLQTATIDPSDLESVSQPWSPVETALPSPKRPSDPLQEGICEDDEDLYFARLALFGQSERPRSPSPPPDSVPPFRKHVTGSARTEGYYKISHIQKSAYVAQYSARSTNVESVVPTAPAAQHVSSRSNRANARRRAQGLEEINQVQRAVALSKGETAAAELTIKFNQLQTRKKHLRFARSPIHDWGLYAMERIARGEMVIEYVGEIIRAQVADKREKLYERQGIGSSYLFRIDEDLVVDATKKGNLG